MKQVTIYIEQIACNTLDEAVAIIQRWIATGQPHSLSTRSRRTLYAALGKSAWVTTDEALIVKTRDLEFLLVDLVRHALVGNSK